MSDEQMTRRDLVRQAAGAAVGGLLASGVQVRAAEKKTGEKGKILNYNPKMGYRRFGRTGVRISEVSLGGHWKTPSGGRYWASFPNDNPPPDVQKNRNDAVVKCAEVGINYLDITTAGEAAIYGRALKQTGVKLYVGYSDHVLCIRNPKNRTVEKMMFEIDEGLRRLQTDRLWLWRPQALMGGGHTEAEMQRVVETYYKAKKQGKVELLGMSAHSHKFVQWVLEKWGDHFHGFVFLYTVSNEPKKSQSLFDVVRKQDVGTVGLKPFHGNSYFAARIRQAKKEGTDPDLNGAAITGLKRILEVPELTCTIPGMTTVEEIANNVRASGGSGKKLTRAEQEMVEQLARRSLDELPADYAWIREQGRYV